MASDTKQGRLTSRRGSRVAGARARWKARRNQSMRGIAGMTAAVLAAGVLCGAQQDGDWSSYGRDAGGERYSPLDRIRRDNVASLQIAWTYHTGDAYQPRAGRATAFEATPLYVEG